MKAKGVLPMNPQTIQPVVWCFVVCAILTAGGAGAASDLEYTAPFVEGSQYDPTVPAPEVTLGYPVGSRPADSQEILRYFQTLSSTVKHVQLRTYGETHEGRDLFYLVVSSPENMARLEEIRWRIGKLADPSKLREGEDAQVLLRETPAVAWMAYSIHGDELSSSDAALWVAYQLAAGNDETSRKIRDNVVVCIDPLQNPDGRERALAQTRMFASKVVNPDVQSAQHNGMWPWGRGNHYFFDLNRDFFILSQPETRARVSAMRDWNPQMGVDSHEMGSLDTYLFSPPREPINPYLSPIYLKWMRVFAENQAKAFDRHGWSYYTREWLDNWFPGYTDWIAYTGAIWILYEQAGTSGTVVRRDDGTAMTYRETVHHHIVSSLSNLSTLAENRQEILKDYYEEKQKALRPPGENEIQAYLIEPATNTTRETVFLENLLRLGVEIHRSHEPFLATGLRTPLGAYVARRSFPSGTWIIPTRQPLKNLVNAVLEFDTRMKDEFLAEERFYLEKKNQSRMYDISAWSMPIAYGVTCYQATAPVNPFTTRVARVPLPEGKCPETRPAYGYGLSTADDASTLAVTRLLEKGFAVRASDKEFRLGYRTFPRGSFLLRNVENRDRAHEEIVRISQETGAAFYGADTALDLNGIDLGGQHFKLLAAPRVAVMMGRPVSTTSYGAIWHLLDERYRYRVSSLDIDSLMEWDLRNYNVILIPSGEIRSGVRESGLEKLKLWVENGGTLIALGSAVSMVTDAKTGLSTVRERGDVLDKLEEYEEAVEREERALTATASQADVWEYHPAVQSATKEEKAKPENVEKLKRQEEWERRFSPQGALLLARTDPYHWLAYGVSNPVVVMTGGRGVFYSKPPVETAVRFADEASLRVSGLLWPEARKRLAKTAYATREGRGKGQIILFPFQPNERGYYPETTRLLWNAIFLGPGLGAEAPLPW